MSRRGARGMTLAEILVASGILIFGIVGVVALIGQATRSHQRAVNETVATQIATSKLNELRATFAQGRMPEINMGPDDRSALSENQGFYLHQHFVELEPRPRQESDPGHEFFVEVRVTWSERGDEQNVILRSICLKREVPMQQPVR